MMFKRLLHVCEDEVEYYWLQCSTVVRNTVVRATIKVNGKPQNLGTRSAKIPELNGLKFDLNDYVGGLTLHAKNGTNRLSEIGREKEWTIMFY